MDETINDCVDSDDEVFIELIEDDWVDETDRRLEVLESTVYELSQKIAEYTTGRDRSREMPQSNFGTLTT